MTIANLLEALIKRATRTLESRSANIYDPLAMKPRPFEADYPQGAHSDEVGRFTLDMDGRPLTGRFVAGRTATGASDTGIPASAHDALGEAGTGRLPQTVAASKIGGDAGRYVVTRDRRSGKVIDRDIYVAKGLPSEQSSMVTAHELSHMIDELAGEVPVKGLNDELRTIYNHLNNPQTYGKRFGPEQNGYKGDKVKRELVAEAIRAYMTDPNYLKTVAPKTAAAIRAAVNPHPNTRNLIQFNSLAGPAAVGGAALAGTALMPSDAQAGEPQSEGKSMVTLDIGGTRVQVDDGFLKLSPEQQNATVEEIAAQMGGGGIQKLTGRVEPRSEPQSQPSTNVIGPDGKPIYRDGAFHNAMAGLNDAIYGTLGAPVDASRNIINWGIAGVNALTGQEDLRVPRRVMSTGRDFARPRTDSTPSALDA